MPSGDKYRVRCIGRTVYGVKDGFSFIKEQWGSCGWTGVRTDHVDCECYDLYGSATTPGSCHEFAETRRSAAVAAGWLVQSRQDPASVPVLVDHGSRWVYLTDSAEYADAPPPAGVA